MRTLWLDNYVIGIPAMVCVILFFVYAQNQVKEWIGPERLSKAHEVSGYYFSVVGTLYAVLLGLIVVSAMGKFNKMEAAVEEEALSLVKIYSMLARFPQVKNELQLLIEDYKKEVVSNEFSLMANKKISPVANSQALRLLDSINGIEPKTLNQQAVYSHLLSETSQFWDARRVRTAVANYGEPAVEWVFLLLGAFLTIAISAFFVEDRLIGSLMTAMTSAIILMSLYLTLLFGDPFSGDLIVSSTPFTLIEPDVHMR